MNIKMSIGLVVVAMVAVIVMAGPATATESPISVSYSIVDDEHIVIDVECAGAAQVLIQSKSASLLNTVVADATRFQIGLADGEATRLTIVAYDENHEVLERLDYRITRSGNEIIESQQPVFSFTPVQMAGYFRWGTIAAGIVLLAWAAFKPEFRVVKIAVGVILILVGLFGTVTIINATTSCMGAFA
jgi:hypothetical protein